MKDVILGFLRANWKTTAAGLTTAIVAAFVNFGIEVDPATRDGLTKVVEFVGIVAIGLFARDAKKSAPPVEEEEA